MVGVMLCVYHILLPSPPMDTQGPQVAEMARDHHAWSPLLPGRLPSSAVRWDHMTIAKNYGQNEVCCFLI